jgi:ATP-dependent RNA helicase DeaD
MSATTTFSELKLETKILSALDKLGYETPTPVQAESIPALMTGRDLSVQAQTGTGKTAAFALPILSRLDLSKKEPQALVIAPTRELAIQVAEAFQSYARDLKGFHVAPIYGGQDYQIQLRALKRGTHVIVGTPGRVMDHLRRGTLAVSALKTVVLDEADEMLKMGFIDDVEWILEQIPHEHQTGLFSATMPPSILKIAKRYLKDPAKIQIKTKHATVDTIEQVYIRVARDKKMDVLTRFLEVEDVKAGIIFTRTKVLAGELAEKLQARGHAAAALHGDMSQSMREKVLTRIKKGSLDLIVATDVAARGIDVERVSHVINYDIPYDAESYIHRIGRTGRAGRQGKALLLITPREQRLLRDIERVTNKTIEQIEPPSIKEMNELRVKQMGEQIVSVIQKSKKLGPYHEMVEDIIAQYDCAPQDIAAAVAYLMQQSNPLPSDDIRTPAEDSGKPNKRRGRSSGDSYGDKPRRRKPRGDSSDGDRPRRKKPSGSRDSSFGDKPRRSKPSGSRDDSFGDSPRRRKSSGSRDDSFGDRPRRSKPSGSRDDSFGDKPRRSKPSGSRDDSFGDKPPRRSKPSGSRDDSFSDSPRRKKPSYSKDGASDDRSHSKKKKSFKDSKSSSTKKHGKNKGKPAGGYARRED